MTPRQLAIVVVAGIAAFAVALGVSSAGGGDGPSAASGEPAEVLDVSAATVKAGAPDAGSLPSLVVPKPKPKPEPENTSSTSSSSSSSAGTVSPPVTETPQAEAPVTQSPPATQSPPVTQSPPASSNNGATSQGPITSSGGED